MEIEGFVSLTELDSMLFERPYYVIPQIGGEKGYVLFREGLKRAEKAVVAKIVLHTVQYLVAVVARENYLVLEILRFSNEILELHEAAFLDPAIKSIKVSEREVSVAEQLVDGMTSKWSREKYANTYHDDLMKLIKAKIRSGKTQEVTEVEPAEEENEDLSNIIDLTALLKKSLVAKRSPKRKTTSEKRA